MLFASFETCNTLVEATKRREPRTVEHLRKASGFEFVVKLTRRL